MDKICTSYALSKEAYDKGIRVESLFWWSWEKEEPMLRQYEEAIYFINHIPAPTASEWLELLPGVISITKVERGFICRHLETNTKSSDTTLQDALCKLYMRLFDEVIIKI